MREDANRLTSIDYADSTPDVTYTYDAVAKRLSIATGVRSGLLRHVHVRGLYTGRLLKSRARFGNPTDATFGT